MKLLRDYTKPIEPDDISVDMNRPRTHIHLDMYGNTFHSLNKEPLHIRTSTSYLGMGHIDCITNKLYLINEKGYYIEYT